MSRTPEHQKEIDDINEHVRLYLEEGQEDSLEWLILQFEPFLKSQTTRYCRQYAGVFSWEQAMQEARIIFMDLVNEFTIGGTAYFNVYMQKKLPRRLWYQFSKEIKRRSRTLSHSDEQMANLHTYDGIYLVKEDRQRLIETEDLRLTEQDFEDHLIEDMETAAKLEAINQCLFDEALLTEREREMFIRSVINKEEQASIAEDWGIKRSRVSRIVAIAIDKIKDHLSLSI